MKTELRPIWRTNRRPSAPPARSPSIHWLATGLGIALAGCLVTACSSKSNPDSELQKAAKTLEEPAPVVAAPAAPAPTPTAAPVAVAAPPPAPSTEMNQAVAAYRAGNLEDAVTRLQRLRATPVLSPQQRIAINDAMASVMGEIYTLAARGDQRAIQAVKQYEKMQTQRR